MMTAPAADFNQRALTALRTLNTMPELRAAVKERVDGFFAAHPGLDRTPSAEGFIASLVLEEFQAAPSGDQPQSKQA